MLGNTALNAALNAQFLVQIGIFTAVPMIMGFILESGLLKVPHLLYFTCLLLNSLLQHLFLLGYPLRCCILFCNK